MIRGLNTICGRFCFSLFSRRAVFLCLFMTFCCFVCILESCRSDAIPEETPLPAEVPDTAKPQPPANTGGIVEEIRTFTERGSPSSLLRALEIIRSRDLGSSEFGRVMTAVNVTLIRALYPALQVQLPQPDPPLTHSYSRIMREAERGVYTAPPQNSTDYLEYVLPFLAYFPGKNIPAERYLSAVPDLEKGAKLNPDSFLPGYFLGIVYENAGRLDESFRQYSLAWEQFPECFPAALGLARVLEGQGRKQETLRFLQDLVTRFPDNIQVKRQLAIAYYRSGDWSRADTAVAEILQKDSHDGEFILMRAHILVEQGQFLPAQAPLDLYAAVNPNNKLYLFLRARVQAEGYHNRDAALNYLRSIIKSAPAAGGADINNLASIYASRLLLESTRPEDKAEGRELLTKLLEDPAPSPDVASLALEDAIRREAWREARPYLTRLLGERRSSQDLLAACTVEKALGNNATVLLYARELYERDRSNDEGIIAYVSALIDTGRQDEAARMIETRLAGIPGGTLKSRYYFLRSRVRNNEELVMNDLRSSLFEDPRNLGALIAMFEIYHRRRDERRAVYYLKQALALSPDNPRLTRYEAEYAAVLGSGF